MCDTKTRCRSSSLTPEGSGEEGRTYQTRQTLGAYGAKELPVRALATVEQDAALAWYLNEVASH